MVQTPALTFLLDTNVVIALEPFAGRMESLQDPLARFVAMALEHGHRIVVHPANRDDLLETADEVHRKQNLAALHKYVQISEVPLTAELEAAAGASAVGTNDWRDLRLLAAVVAGGATHLVTGDEKLIRRAGRAGVGEQAITAEEALELLRQLHPSDPPTPPSVDTLAIATLDLTQPIFESLRNDYEGFNDWLRKAASQGKARRTWVVRDTRGGYRAIAIVKTRDDHPIVPGAKATKLSTFKVDSESEGEKLGELLLKTVLMWAHETNVETLFVTVLNDEGKQPLIHFLGLFGFDNVGTLPNNPHELVLIKQFIPDPAKPLPPLEHHVAFGPPALEGSAEVFVIPIIPHWYEGLFPDAPSVGEFGQMTLGGLMAETQPFGNALRKAYLSNANIKGLPPGSTVLFYRSAGIGGGGAVHAVGVVEKTMRSNDPAALMAFVGRRTVYTANQVAAMCEDDGGNHREVLAVLFRQDRFVPQPWTLSQLLQNKVLRGVPQAITQVHSQEGVEWVYRQLAE